MKVYSQSIRIFLNISFEKTVVFTIIEKQAHYLINVMRVKVGNIILVFNGFEGEYKVQITNKKNDSIICKVIEKVRDQYYEPKLNLIFSLVTAFHLHEFQYLLLALEIQQKADGP